MALLIMEGFDLRDRHLPYTTYVTNNQVGRFGGFCFSSTGAEYINLPQNNTYSELFIGFALRRNSGNTGTILIVGSASDVDQNRVNHFSIAGTSTDQLVIKRGSTVLHTSAPGVLIPDTWVYVEIRLKLSETVGVIEIKINGSVIHTFNGDTLDSTTYGTFADFISLGVSNVFYDDMYVCDTSGATYNTYLGEIQIETLTPNGNGTYSQLLGSDGNSVDNYLLVDEIPAVLTDKVVGTAGQRDSYAFTNPTLTGQALAVQISASFSKDNAGSAGVKFLERLASGSERLSATAIPASNQGLYTTGPKITDPDDAVWTVASISGAQFGIEVT